MDSECFREFMTDEVGHGMHISTCSRIARAVSGMIGNEHCGKLVRKIAKAGQKQPSHVERDFHNSMREFAPDFGLRPYSTKITLLREERLPS